MKASRLTGIAVTGLAAAAFAVPGAASAHHSDCTGGLNIVTQDGHMPDVSWNPEGYCDAGLITVVKVPGQHPATTEEPPTPPPPATAAKRKVHKARCAKAKKHARHSRSCKSRKRSAARR